MAKGRVRLRGRTVVFLGLLGFLLITTGVIWRRSVGFSQAREIRQLEDSLSDLRARRTRLEGGIREEASRARLVPAAGERLQLRVPADSQVIILTRPGRNETP